MKILLTGTYSSFNKGDAAMELCAIEAFGAARSPAPEVAVLAPFPEVDAPFYAPTPVYGCDRRRLILSSMRLAVLGLRRLLGGRGVPSPAWPVGASARRTAESDLVVDLSGDMLTEDYGVHVAVSHYIPLLRAALLGVPYAICAQSIGPFRWTRFLARWLIENADTVAVRDAISHDYLIGIGIAPDRVRLTADLAFLLTPPPPERTDALLARSGAGEGPLIGVSVSALVGRRFDRAVGRDGAFAETMAEVLATLAREMGASILFTPHVTGPTRSKDDRIASAAVRDALPAGVEAAILDGDPRPEEIKGAIARTDLFIGTRMHANIAALSSRVPIVAIAYSHKTPGIMRACGMGDFVIDVSALSAETLLERARAARDDDTLRKRLDAAVRRQEALSRETVALVLGEAPAIEARA